MSENQPSIEQLFRRKYGEVLAALLGRFGHQQFELVEEAVQTAFQKALEKWTADNLPDNPGGWLYRVAGNDILEALRRAQTEEIKLERMQGEQAVVGKEPDALSEFSAAAVSDDLAAMILLCCNPRLTPKAQVCLTLKSACGFSVPQIARAMGMQDEATKKTITRAKKSFAAQRETLSALDPERIAARFVLVEETIYAMFTEGYAASSGESQLRRDIAEEAIRLTDIFLQSSVTPPAQQGELQALMALMLFQFSRFAARVTPAGLPVRLQEQDRSLWNQEMIAAGLAALAASQEAPNVSALHLEARIAAEHATSRSFATTRWDKILALYDQLQTVKDTPEVRLSRTVAVHYTMGWEAALAELDGMAVATVAQSFLQHAIRADLLEAAGRPAQAKEAWREARSEAPTAADRAFVEQKINELS
ncbi:MAG: sigma-70 family RNA polymerase sigma factor [Candidatus Promineifilaceae bacterium]|nr:sigma-70 family RNA polymerase sigma factor [Candidatus Promineifilaceae bacterium]